MEVLLGLVAQIIGLDHLGIVVGHFVAAQLVQNVLNRLETFTDLDQRVIRVLCSRQVGNAVFPLDLVVESLQLRTERGPRVRLRDD